MKPERLELEPEPPTTTHPDSSDAAAIAAPVPAINRLTICSTPTA